MTELAGGGGWAADSGGIWDLAFCGIWDQGWAAAGGCCGEAVMGNPETHTEDPRVWRETQLRWQLQWLQSQREQLPGISQPTMQARYWDEILLAQGGRASTWLTVLLGQCSRKLSATLSQSKLLELQAPPFHFLCISLSSRLTPYLLFMVFSCQLAVCPTS